MHMLCIPEKKEEEDSPEFKITMMLRYNYFMTTWKVQRKTDYSDQKKNTGNTNINRTKITRKQNRKKNKCMGISSDKQTKFHMKKLGQDYERETFGEKLNLSK